MKGEARKFPCQLKQTVPFAQLFMEFETLYQDLAHGAEIIRALVVGVTQAEAQVKPTPESWSILEVVCHLGDEEREDFRQRVDLIQ